MRYMYLVLLLVGFSAAKAEDTVCEAQNKAKLQEAGYTACQISSYCSSKLIIPQVISSGTAENTKKISKILVKSFNEAGCEGVAVLKGKKSK